MVDGDGDAAVFDVGEGGERDHGSGGGLDVDALEVGGVVLPGLGDLEDDVVLVEGLVGGGDLGLAEGVGEGVVDGEGGDAEAGGGVAVDDEVGFEAVVLLVGGDVFELGELLHGGEELGGPEGEDGFGVGGEGVLVLGGVVAAADLELLRGLEVEGDAGHVGGLGGDALDDAVGGVVGLAAFGFGPEDDEEIGLVGGAAAGATSAEEAHGVEDGGVVFDDGHDLLHLVVHGVDAGVLLGADLAVEAAGVLLGEEAFGDGDEEIDVEGEGEAKDEEGEALVVEDPTEASGVLGGETCQVALAHAEEPAFADFAVGLEELGREHGGGGEGDDEGDGDGDGEGDGELAEEAAYDAAHEQDGDEDRDERGRHGEDGEADFAGAFEGGVEGGEAFFEMAGDVFDDDDGVVDDEAGGDGEGHEAEVVERVAEHVHDAEGAEEGERDGDRGDEGGAGFAEEDEDYKDDEEGGEDEGSGDVADGGADGGGAVEDGLELDGGKGWRLAAWGEF